MNPTFNYSNPKKVVIIPFRFYKGQIEVLLKVHVVKVKAFISEISGEITENDPSPIFCAARVFLTEFLGMNYKLDEKVRKLKNFRFILLNLEY